MPKNPPSPVDSAIAERIASKIEAIATKAGGIFTIRTSSVAELGSEIEDILIDARENDPGFKFDETISRINGRFKELNPESPAPDAVNWLKLHMALGQCVKLGIPDADQVGFKRWVILFGPAFTMDKKAIALDVRLGWADWLKAAIPINRPGPDQISSPSLRASILAHRSALHEANPTIHPKGKAPGSGRKPSVSQSIPPSLSNTIRPAPSKPEPLSISALSVAITQADPRARRETATTLGLALVKVDDLAALIALADVINPAIKAHKSSKLAANAATGLLAIA